MSSLNIILGVVAAIGSVCLVISVPGIIIAAIVEGNKPAPLGQKKSHKVTKIFGIMLGCSILLLILTLVGWGVSLYYVNKTDVATFENTNTDNHENVTQPVTTNANTTKVVNVNSSAVIDNNTNSNTETQVANIYNECFYLAATSADCQYKTAIPSADLDQDQDNIRDNYESVYGSSPKMLDSDNDGKPDGLEIAQHTNPNSPNDDEFFQEDLNDILRNGDDDFDGLYGIEERLLGLDQQSNDTDNDGYNDAEEIINGYDPDGSGEVIYQYDTTEDWATANKSKFGTIVGPTFEYYFGLE